MKHGNFNRHGFFEKLGVEPKSRRFHPKMDGENHGSKPYEQMDDLGGFPHIFGNNQLALNDN